MSVIRDKILVIRHGAFGDIVQADGALRDIRAHHPGAEIILLTTPRFRKLMERCPHVDRLVIDERPPPITQIGKLMALRHALLAEGFSRVYDLQSSRRTKNYRRFLLPKADWNDNRDFNGRPMLECYRLQLERAGMKSTHAMSPDVSWMADDMSVFLANKGVRPGYVFLIPGCAAKHLHKRWPCYAGLARELISLGHQVVTAPGPDEIELCKSIPGITLLGPKDSLNWFELAGVIHSAAFVVSNDTGPSHVAACLNRPGLALFGAIGSDARTGIMRARFIALEVDDLKELPVNHVLDAILPRLPEHPAK
jgi:ADP-heptose:LPS heptosyltransferase